MRMGMTIVGIALLGLAGSLHPAPARSGHHGGFGGHRGAGGGLRGSAMRSGGALASDQRHANDDYVKAASQEEDKLLDSKIKSICNGC